MVCPPSMFQVPTPASTGRDRLGAGSLKPPTPPHAHRPASAAPPRLRTTPTHVRLVLVHAADVDVVVALAEHADGGEALDEVLPAQVHLRRAVHLHVCARGSGAAPRVTSLVRPQSPTLGYGLLSVSFPSPDMHSAPQHTDAPWRSGRGRPTRGTCRAPLWSPPPRWAQGAGTSGTNCTQGKACTVCAGWRVNWPTPRRLGQFLTQHPGTSEARWSATSPAHGTPFTSRPQPQCPIVPGCLVMREPLETRTALTRAGTPVPAISTRTGTLVQT